MLKRFILLMAVLLILSVVGLNLPAPEEDSSPAESDGNDSTQTVSATGSSSTATSTPAEEATAPDLRPGFYPVVKVIDGDTVKVRRDGVVEVVRLIGVDTPETVHPNRPVECFGQEASRFTKKQLGGQSVRLVSDGTQANRDRYGRLLRYVYLTDGVNFNRELIRQGYAYEYTYRTPYFFQEEFQTAEKEARQANRGLWAPGVCPQ